MISADQDGGNRSFPARPVAPVRAVIPARHPIHATVAIPGSKSLTNRALLTAALADGASCLTGALFSDDTHYMAAALQQAGIDVASDAGKHQFAVHGAAGQPGPVQAPIFVGNSGVTMRFLTAFFCLGQGTYVLDGAPRMRERPIQELLDALKSLGATVESQFGNGCPPVVVQGGAFKGGRAAIPGHRSSQFLSAVLLSAPYAAHPVEIEVIGALASRPYLDLTTDVMAAFGVPVENENYRRFRVAAGRYRGRSYAVEPDASAASYFLAAAAITNGTITIEGLSLRSRQGDIEFARLLEQMGCSLQDRPEGLTLTGASELSGIDVDMNACSDVSLTLAAIAPFCSTPTHIRNIAHVRVQETDRISAMVTELRRAGVTVEEREDGLSVYPSQPSPTTFDTYEDHRIAMSLALIGLRIPGCAIRDPGCVSKTFPGYFELLESVVGGGMKDEG